MVIEIYMLDKNIQSKDKFYGFKIMYELLDIGYD